MKPIVIYLKEKCDKIELTRKEFEEYITKAYEQGYNCGYAEGRKMNWWSNPITYSTNTTPPTITTTTPYVSPNNDFTITCEANNTTGD